MKSDFFIYGRVKLSNLLFKAYIHLTILLLNKLNTYGGGFYDS